MIRLVMMFVVAAALWRRATRGKYALGLLPTIGFGLFGAVLGGVAADQLVGGSSLTRDIAAGVGALGGAVLLVYGFELHARRRKGLPLRRPPAKRRGRGR